MHYEVEQKFRVDELISIEQRLLAMGGKPQGGGQQVDRYFAHPARDFAKTDEALRIRSVGNDNYVTYKGPKIDATTKTRQEIELPLPSGANIRAEYGHLLESLGFRPVAEVHKQRRTIKLSWEDFEVEAALDEVVDVGSFVELEISASEVTLSRAREALERLAAQLQLTASERRSYLELLLSAK